MQKILALLFVATQLFAEGVIVTKGAPSCRNVTDGYVYTAQSNKCIWATAGGGGGTWGTITGTLSNQTDLQTALNAKVGTVGAFSASAQTNGASISGSTITFGPASATVPGMVGTAAQSFAGVKTFGDQTIFAKGTATTLGIAFTSAGYAGNAKSGFYLEDTYLTNEDRLHLYTNNLLTASFYSGGSAGNASVSVNGTAFSTKGFKGTSGGGFSLNPDGSNQWLTAVGDKRVTTGDTNATIGNTEGYHGVTALTAPRTLTLPNANNLYSETELTIKDESGAAGTYPITIARASTNTIDGQTSIKISTNYGSVRLKNDSSSKWWVIYRNNDPSQIVVPTGTDLTISADHIKLAAAASPTVSSCGTSPSISGTDTAGAVTVGTGGVASTCLITFATTWANAPHCFANDKSEIVAVSFSATSTTTATISKATPFAASSVIDYFCVGN